MNKLFDKYNVFISYEENQIEERLHRIPEMIGYYQNLFYTLQTKHTKYRFELDRTWQEKYLYYKNDFNFTLSNSEIKIFIDKDLEYMNLKQKLQEVTDTLNQTEIVLKGLKDMSWSLKTLIDWKKFQMGVFN